MLCIAIFFFFFFFTDVADIAAGGEDSAEGPLWGHHPPYDVRKAGDVRL